MHRSSILLALLPALAAAQAAPSPAEKPETPPAAVAAPPPGVAATPSQAAPPAVAAPVVTPPAPPSPPAAEAPPVPKPGVTVDLSGWLQLGYYRDYGGLAAGGNPVGDLPLYAIHGDRATGLSVRQSRVRAALGLPSDGLLGGATLKGLVELDFMGVSANDDPSLPGVRLRHAWLAAAWKEKANLTLTLGQTWGLLGGPYCASSLAHLAVPRFAGAGFLYRRAPQVRVSAETSGPLALSAQVAVLAPMDKARSGGLTVGERSGVPDVEGRVAATWRRGGAPVAELGASGLYGRRSWQLTGVAGTPDQTVDAWGAALDARVTLPYVTLLGAAWMGQALGVYNTVAQEVRLDTDASANVVGVHPVRNEGAWAQVIVAPIPAVELFLGYGIENPRVADLPNVAATNPSTVNRNQQTSGGGMVSLTSRWKVSAEITWYLTNTQDFFQRNATQLELASLYAF